MQIKFIKTAPHLSLCHFIWLFYPPPHSLPRNDDICLSLSMTYLLASACIAHVIALFLETSAPCVSSVNGNMENNDVGGQVQQQTYFSKQKSCNRTTKQRAVL